MSKTIKKKLRPDAKGRIALGKLADNVSSFDLNIMDNGDIVLKPFMEIPKEFIDDTEYLLSDPKNKQRLIESIKQLKQGKYQTRELVD